MPSEAMGGGKPQRPNRHEVIGPDDMLSVAHGEPGIDGELAKVTIELVNMLVTVCSPLRNQAPGVIDGPLITALATYAGCIHGELLAMGMAPEVTEAGLNKLLLTNFQSGAIAGKRKVERLAQEAGVDPATGRPPEPGQ